ncbi:MAG: chromosome segregation protein ScpA [Candidatus Omnitrophica bacterium CG07_land_8_20_14_0_80_42_15]|uniref:Segregation and condensation protein A n=1 Tax=Candidatus Aquitaenariimonas noxiae TaxID=1974741 RepID=A0A2J0L1L7_9BACT|nr:MAG: chromosome segregation protein ScpA [Candidatus Omnitrophica bacterium CG07_land_8_20_14_0_80_42_15]
MSYKVKLEVFEGPLDLLLYLIRKEELDISDIPIAKITDQYLEYLEFMKMLDLNIAGEFILMAATLMHIKSKMLLPKTDEGEIVEEEDPRAELVRRLLEYKKFKEAAGELFSMEMKQKDVFARGVAEDNQQTEEKEEYFEASLFDLLSAFNKVMKEIPKDTFHQVIKDEFTVEEKMHDIFHMLVKKTVIYVTELFKSAKNKREIITIFLALLELIRLKEVVIMQKQMFGDIEIVQNKELMEPKFRSKGQ